MEGDIAENSSKSELMITSTEMQLDEGHNLDRSDKVTSGVGQSEATAEDSAGVQFQEEPLDVDTKDTETSPGLTDKNEPASKSDDCVLMEYRSAGAGGINGNASDADSEDSSSSSDSSDSEDNEAADAKINKALSHKRDESPEGIRRVKLNRHGFEDIRTKGELLPEELPPLEELTITVDEKVEMMCVGKIASIVGVLVVIESGSDVPPLNDDTILFVEGHKVLGQVFEVFGPVKSPWYSVRFNDPENIKAKELTVGMPVYCAPKEECFTKYVFVDSLKQMRGSDASWEDNNEPPEKYLDYSDDEAERQAKSKRKNKKTTQDGDRDGENMEKRNKNEYNQQQRQNNTERPPRGHRGGGNQRFSHPRGRGGNPFQGQNQQAPRPRFASGHSNQPQSDWNSNNRFNSPRWQAYRKNNRGNFDNDEERYTAERVPDFGGPPSFSPGPRFNRNFPRSQFTPQNQSFGNRMGNRVEQSTSASTSKWNQFSQNNFSNNQHPGFMPNSGPSPQQNRPQFPCSDRLPTPPPALPPPPVSSPFNYSQGQPGQFITGPRPSSFTQFQNSQSPPCPSPDAGTMGNQNPSFSTVPFHSQEMKSQFCAVPASMVPKNCTVFVPVSQMMGTASQVQQGGQIVGPALNGQFNPCVPSGQSNSSQNTCIPTPLNGSNAFAQPNNFGGSVNGGQRSYTQAYCSDNGTSNTFLTTGGNNSNQMQNNLQSGLHYMGNNYQNKMVQNNVNENYNTGQNNANQNGVNFPQNQPATSLSENFAGARQTENQQLMYSTGTQDNRGAGTHSSQTLPFQDAKYLHNMISAGLQPNNQGMDSRLMQNSKFH